MGLKIEKENVSAGLLGSLNSEIGVGEQRRAFSKVGVVQLLKKGVRVTQKH